jgi:hypothetical protein
MEEQAMKHRPILFSTDMVQAILEGRKTQTRRVVKTIDARGFRTNYAPFEDFYGRVFKCPYGQPGDVLWVRETWAPALNDFAYKADYSEDVINEPQNKGLWKPSIHMPREAARLFLRIKSVRVKRLQDISEDDACEEGIEVKTMPNADAGDYNCYPRNYMISEKDADGWPYFNEEQYIESFRTLWQSINGPESWDANPWVWVVEFERISREKAEV